MRDHQGLVAAASAAGFAAMLAFAAVAAVVELGPDPAYPLTAGAALEAGEPAKLDAAGRAVPLGEAGTALFVALGDAASNETVTVKAGVFGFPAATNLTAAANGGPLGWDAGRACATNGAAVLGRCIYIDTDSGTAYVRVGE